MYKLQSSIKSRLHTMPNSHTHSFTHMELCKLYAYHIFTTSKHIEFLPNYQNTVHAIALDYDNRWKIMEI